MQREITHSGPLLTLNGNLAQIGWSRQPLLDCNLEALRFYRFRFLQRFRLKRWDYYAVFTPQHFFSATIADLGYAGNVFVYAADFVNRALHEESLVLPLARGVVLPRNSQSGHSRYHGRGVRLDFLVEGSKRRIQVDWPSFDRGQGLEAEITLEVPQGAESMNIVIPIGSRRFYFNRKINCLPARGTLRYGDLFLELDPTTCLGSLDWGRGVWEYRSFWNWASASGYLSDGRTLGLNLGCGFGDLSAATENALILANRIHKLDQVAFEYQPRDYMQPWRFTDNQGRLDLTFTPFLERTALTNLGIIYSEVHQVFGRYNGFAVADDGEKVPISDLIGFAEEHRARW
ncbi:MAG: DUF2804 domain-containing protein [Anaerolineales bacterium]|nr:DUF2804 domain-containing protein [Anaerolineales bacterium]MCS7247672.1 DUF2804 domain-containing protein [Anaerolineales bacterium]MDW8161482.1 DUF2804 domain-containing protein [Anaerolineales bacterium]MDW8446885.1 DUF2804 domain-containing protein [Anaerolineales bacterium]